MPKDEFDFEDPFELNGVALLTEEDTTDDMAECFIEEFLRLGYNHKQVFVMFRNPHYLGMHMVWEKRGEQYVRDRIQEVFARWGRPFEWPANHTDAAPPASQPAEVRADLSAPKPAAMESSSSCGCHSCGCGSAPAAQESAFDPRFTDPLGNPAPKLNL